MAPPPAPGPGGGLPPPPPAQPPYAGGGPYSITGRRNRGRSLLAGAGIAVAIGLAAAALVVSLTRPVPVQAPAAQPAPPAAGSPATPANTEAADRALCTAIAPLMAESDRTAHEFVDPGPAGSPERDAAIPSYRAQTGEWARRTQDVLNAHYDASPFFQRTLQRFIDDRKLYVANVRPGPAKSYDDAAWADSMVAYGGPLAICQALDVTW